MAEQEQDTLATVKVWLDEARQRLADMRYEREERELYDERLCAVIANIDRATSIINVLRRDMA